MVTESLGHIVDENKESGVVGIDIIAFNGANDVEALKSLTMPSRWHHRCRSRRVWEMDNWASQKLVKFIARIFFGSMSGQVGPCARATQGLDSANKLSSLRLPSRA